MINITGLYKSYGNQSVFENFNCTFPEKGLILLFGESGCGKTTLLNLIGGLTDFQKGSIIINNNEYKNQVNTNEIKNYVGYMTQDCYWIDYLTIGEQMELSGEPKETILELLDEVYLKDKYNSYFNELSGGQQQRVCLIQAILHKKEVLLLDEPTANLDEENKKSVFEAIEKLKNKILVICSTHDKQFFNYCDRIIDFSSNKIKILQNDSSNIPIIKKERRITKPQLYKYYKKWFKSKQYDKKSLWMLAIVYFLSFLAVFIADSPKHKETESIKDLYRINQCSVILEPTDLTFVESRYLFEENILDIVLQYNGSCPSTNVNGKEIDTLYNTLPHNKNAFKYADKIIAGDYFSDKYQVILSYEKALEYGDIDDIIGRNISLEMYDGLKQMTIVGVFSEFSETEEQYLNQSFLAENNGIFISSEYTQDFWNDKNFSWHGQRNCVLYFNDYEDMTDFVASNSFPDYDFFTNNIDYRITSLFILLFCFMIPAIILIVFCALVLYYQTKRLELAYNSHHLSIYDYLGFEKTEIKKCWVLGNLYNFLKIIIPSGICAFIISAIFNFMNLRFSIIPFTLFSYNFLIITIFILSSIILSLIISSSGFKVINTVNWYHLFLKNRDIL